MTDFADIAPKAPTTTLTAAHIQAGPPLTPFNHVLLYSSDQWEEFVDEWASRLKTKYSSVQRYAGANDKGIDVAAFASDKKLLGPWDNYQCKHYDHSLHPTDAWPELGKILWYSFSGDYMPPRAYYFVAPRDVGTTLALYLANATVLRTKLIEAWDKYCRNAITKTAEIPLEGDFRTYVEAFDFGIFQMKPLREVIDEHRASPHFIGRFGGGFPARPVGTGAPLHIAPHESAYVTKLYGVYGEKIGSAVTSADDLKGPKLLDHFKRQREAFYQAEALRVFVRDKVEPGTFESLQDEIFNSVIDVRDATHSNGYDRVVAVTQAARNLPLTAHPLAPTTFSDDKHGICHQLANEDRLQWTE